MSEFLARTEGVTPGRFDWALRHWLSEGFAVEEDGSVDEHGHIALVEITKEDIAFLANTEGDPRLSVDFKPGWYVIQTDGLGFVYGHMYRDEETARSDFGTASWILAQAAGGTAGEWL